MKWKLVSIFIFLCAAAFGESALSNSSVGEVMAHLVIPDDQSCTSNCKGIGCTAVVVGAKDKPFLLASESCVAAGKSKALVALSGAEKRVPATCEKDNGVNGVLTCRFETNPTTPVKRACIAVKKFAKGTKVDVVGAKGENETFSLIQKSVEITSASSTVIDAPTVDGMNFGAAMFGASGSETQLLGLLGRATFSNLATSNVYNWMKRNGAACSAEANGESSDIVDRCKVGSGYQCGSLRPHANSRAGTRRSTGETH